MILVFNIAKNDDHDGVWEGMIKPVPYSVFPGIPA